MYTGTKTETFEKRWARRCSCIVIQLTPSDPTIPQSLLMRVDDVTQ